MSNKNFMVKNKKEINKKLDTKVIVGFPDSININLVPANELQHYERFQWLVVMLLPIATGFWTACFTINEAPKSLSWSAAMFSAVSLLFIVLAYLSRRKIFHGSIKKEMLLRDFK